MHSKTVPSVRKEEEARQNFTFYDATVISFRYAYTAFDTSDNTAFEKDKNSIVIVIQILENLHQKTKQRK